MTHLVLPRLQERYLCDSFDLRAVANLAKQALFVAPSRKRDVSIINAHVDEDSFVIVAETFGKRNGSAIWDSDE